MKEGPWRGARVLRHRRIARALWRAGIFSLLLLLRGMSLSAQVIYDPADGRYTVMVYNDDDRLVPMTIQSPARVRVVSFGSAVVLANGMVRYQWMIGVRGASPDPMGVVWVPCPAAARIDSLLFQTTHTNGHVVNGFRHFEQRSEFCEFLTRVEPGDSMVVDVISSYLPGFGEIRTVGSVSGASWPTSDPSSSNERFESTVDSLSGVYPWGLHVGLETVLPLRPPELLDDVNGGITALMGDLQMACDRSWVAPRGVCQSLEAKLNTARESLLRGDRNALLAQLHAFRQELGNQERTHITPEAAAVLDITASWIEAHL